jgi:hypothetical protein
MLVSRRKVVGLGVMGSLGVAFKAAAKSPTASQTGCTDKCGPGGCTFKGLANIPRGNAILHLNASCQLVVDNITGSGRDGVDQINLSSTFMRTTLALPNFSGSMAGTMAMIRQLGVVEGQPNQEVMFTRVVNYNNTRIRVSVDCSTIFVAKYLVEVYSLGTLVAILDLGIDPPVITLAKVDMRSMACGIEPNGDVFGDFRWGARRRMTLLGVGATGSVTGDRVNVRGLSPGRVATLQQTIENVFMNTGPVTLAGMVAK